MDKYYRFAGVELAVHIPDGMMYTDDRFLASFRVSEVASPYHFYFELTDDLTPPEGSLTATLPSFVVYTCGDCRIRYINTANGSWETAHMRTRCNQNVYHVQLKAAVYPKGPSAKTVLNAMEAEHLIPHAGGFVFHCAYIAHKGGAILFTAPSGTGKSTQAALWEQLRGAEVINGDRAAVRVTDSSITANGIPFAGSSQICQNRTLPVTAVVYLAQASQTSIRKLSGAEAFRRIWEGVSVNVWNKEDMNLILDNVQQLVQRIPVYYLACTPDESAVSALEQMLGR